jgi:hypothetical protein
MIVYTIVICDLQCEDRVDWSYFDRLSLVVNEDRADWSYLDHLSLIVRFQTRAIRCDWGLRYTDFSAVTIIVSMSGLTIVVSE